MIRNDEEYSSVRIRKTDLPRFKMLSTMMDKRAPDLLIMLIDYYIDENRINFNKKKK